MKPEAKQEQNESIKDDHPLPIDEVNLFDAWDERLKMDFDPSPSEIEF